MLHVYADLGVGRQFLAGNFQLELPNSGEGIVSSGPWPLECGLAFSPLEKPTVSDCTGFVPLSRCSPSGVWPFPCQAQAVPTCGHAGSGWLGLAGTALLPTPAPAEVHAALQHPPSGPV